MAGETKTAVVATDKNAPEDQILHFVVRHKEQVGSIELMVQDVRLGELQVFHDIHCDICWLSESLGNSTC